MLQAKVDLKLLITLSLLAGFAWGGRDSFAATTTDWGVNNASWGEARELYDNGKFSEALKSFQAAPAETASYYYNLGNIYYRMGELGPAVAHFEKANRLQMHDPDIQHNLQLARTALGKVIGTDRLDPASSWTESISDHVSLDEIRGAIGVLGVILGLLWIRAYAKTRSIRHSLLQPAGILGILGFALTAGLYGAQRISESHPAAVCLSRQVVRSGPGDHFVELAEIDGGEKIRVLGPSAPTDGALPQPPSEKQQAPLPTTQTGSGELWRQIRFSEDGIGWVRSSSLLLL